MDGHSLENDLAGTLDYGVEDSLAAEDGVLDAAGGDDVHRAGRVHRYEIARVNDHRLTCRKRVFDRVAVDLYEGNTLTADLLHYESLTAEEAGAELFLEVKMCGG